MLFVKSRNGWGLAIGCLLVFIGSLTLPADLVNNPFDYSRGQIIVNLVPSIASFVWPLMAYSPMNEMEKTIPVRIMERLRLGWWLMVATALIVCGALAFALRNVDIWYTVSHIRNSLFALAIATLTCLVLPVIASWIPLVLYTGLCWIVGTSDLIGTPRVWAIPHYLADSWVALGVTVILCAISLPLYCFYERASLR